MKYMSIWLRELESLLATYCESYTYLCSNISQNNQFRNKKNSFGRGSDSIKNSIVNSSYFNKNLETQFGYITITFGSRPIESLPNNTEVNPKEELKITLGVLVVHHV